MTSVITGYAWVALGGALGAMARMGVGHWVRNFAGGVFPWHTFVINVAGSFALGLTATAIGIKAPASAAAYNHFLAIGFLGAFTTFSTFELETWNLVAAGRWMVALGYVASSVLVAFGGLAAGVVMGRML